MALPRVDAPGGKQPSGTRQDAAPPGGTAQAGARVPEGASGLSRKESTFPSGSSPASTIGRDSRLALLATLRGSALGGNPAALNLFSAFSRLGLDPARESIRGLLPAFAALIRAEGGIAVQGNQASRAGSGQLSATRAPGANGLKPSHSARIKAELFALLSGEADPEARVARAQSIFDSVFGSEAGSGDGEGEDRRGSGGHGSSDPAPGEGKGFDDLPGRDSADRGAENGGKHAGENACGRSDTADSADPAMSPALAAATDSPPAGASAFWVCCPFACSCGDPAAQGADAAALPAFAAAFSGLLRYEVHPGDPAGPRRVELDFLANGRHWRFSSGPGYARLFRSGGFQKPPGDGSSGSGQDSSVSISGMSVELLDLDGGET